MCNPTLDRWCFFLHVVSVYFKFTVEVDLRNLSYDNNIWTMETFCIFWTTVYRTKSYDKVRY